MSDSVRLVKTSVIIALAVAPIDIAFTKAFLDCVCDSAWRPDLAGHCRLAILVANRRGQIEPIEPKVQYLESVCWIINRFVYKDI